jgi:hypothetical protein
MTERSEVIIWLSPWGRGASSLPDRAATPKAPTEAHRGGEAS